MPVQERVRCGLMRSSGTRAISITRPLRVSAAEIEQVIDDPASIWRVNRKGRTATHLVSGRTAGGTAVRVAVLYDPVTRTARPITAMRID